MQLPLNHPRQDLPEAMYHPELLRVCRASHRLFPPQAAPELCTYRYRGLACRMRFGWCHRPEAGYWLQRQIAPQPTQPLTYPNQSSTHRASSSRPRECALTNQTCLLPTEGTRVNGVMRTEHLTTRRSSVR